MNRREFLNTASLMTGATLLFGCSALSGNPATELKTAQLYAGDMIDALAAGAQVYVASPNAQDAGMVEALVLDMQTFKTAFLEISDISSAKSIATQIISASAQLSPIVAPFLGGAGPYIPLALAVLQAFIDSLPLPSKASAEPPAALHRMALTYRHHNT